MNDNNTLATQTESYSPSEYMAELGLTLNGVLEEDVVQEVTGEHEGEKQWGAVEGVLDSGPIDECAVIGIVGPETGYMFHSPIENYDPEQFLNEELDPFLIAVKNDYGGELNDLEAFACGTNFEKPKYWSDDHQNVSMISEVWAIRGLMTERLDDLFGTVEYQWEMNSDHNTRLTVDVNQETIDYDPEYDTKI